jgi:hypothetical protein
MSVPSISTHESGLGASRTQSTPRSPCDLKCLALALAAAVSGSLFTINSALPFSVMAIISASLVTTTLW